MEALHLRGAMLGGGPSPSSDLPEGGFAALPFPGAARYRDRARKAAPVRVGDSDAALAQVYFESALRVLAECSTVADRAIDSAKAIGEQLASRLRNAVTFSGKASPVSLANRSVHSRSVATVASHSLAISWSVILRVRRTGDICARQRISSEYALPIPLKRCESVSERFTV